MTDATNKPGKIIAIHLSYHSRMRQRGRTPKNPSYFFKPSSSIAMSGSTIERPASTELLAFEGEIALIIGKTARRVTPEHAWQHVEAVTAANDFGLYDMRDADGGSNVRSKGGDGFTPLGPEAISVVGLNEGDLRVRTWRNGELVQEDTSANMKFSFSHIIADLSQLLTLEPGDIILTGTPAGSSVALPGDTIEVEVDVVGGATSTSATTTGKLVTRVVQSEVGFAEWGAMPIVTDKQKIDAWGSEAALGEAVREGRSTPLASPDQNVLTDEIRSLLDETAVATVSAALRRRGYVDVFIDGVLPNKQSARILGPAKTVRFIPFRPDLFEKYGGGFNAQKLAFDTVEPGEVIVIEARGVRETGTVGDVMALRAQYRGAAGVVTDGGVRDFAQVQSFEMPVFSFGAHPSVLGRKHVPWQVDETIACGGVAVQPGDIIMGDGDGVIVIPPQLLEEVAREAHEQESVDSWVAERVAEGHKVDGLFPMNESWRAKYEADKASAGTQNSSDDDHGGVIYL